MCTFAGGMEKVRPSLQYEVFSQLRLPLIILVTFAHSYSAVSEGYSVLTSGWDAYEVLKIVVGQTLTRIAMPTFFVMSGYLFFANVDVLTKEVYWQKMRRRAKTLLLPYVVWNLLMAAKLGSLHLSMLWEPANMPLWFLRDLIIVSLLTPIIYISIRRLGWWIVALLLPVYLTGIWAIQPGLNPYAVCFFTLGVLMSIRRIDLVDVSMRVEKGAYGLFAVCFVSLILTYGQPVFPLLLLVFRVVGLAVVFCGAHRILSNTSRRLPKTVCDASYFIYLAHYVLFFSFIDTVFRSVFGTSTTALCLHYLLCPLLKIALLLAIYELYRMFLRRRC